MHFLKVLEAFKSIHRTKDYVFQGDDKTIKAARTLINEEYRKNQNVENGDEIKKLLEISKDVENELRTNVIQAKEKEPGVYGKITNSIFKKANLYFLFDIL